MDTSHSIDITMESADWAAALPDAEAIAAAAAAAALGGAAISMEVSLVLAGDEFQRALNRDYRGRDEATNVLSFPGDPPPGAGQAPDHPTLLGDVVVAFGVTRREAEAQGSAIGLADHLSHLIIHGVLHLLGHDHQSDAEAEAMERLESRLLAGLGIADPHRRTVAPGARDLDNPSPTQGEEHDERRPG
jgi:probable rRNA maturation factor